MKFCRWGGLSAVKYKKPKYDNGKQFSSEFHRPPRRYGIYAFPWPFIEMFLVYWKSDYKDLNKTYRIFDYEGEFWCHFVKSSHSSIIKGSWVLTDTDEYPRLFKEHCKWQKKIMYKHCFGEDSLCKHPYIRPLGGFNGRDDLEVFIEKSV
ncbi:MAG TPA: hypothetical protein PLV67_05985 [Methanofastidiosum sp.]|nr:hypothetical protein [Methanofastidiosum sp.]